MYPAPHGSAEALARVTRGAADRDCGDGAMEYTATFHESSLGVNLERAVLHGPAHRKGKGA